MRIQPISLGIISVLLLCQINSVSASNRCNNAPRVCGIVKAKDGCNHSYMILNGHYHNCSWSDNSCHIAESCHVR